MLVKRHVHVPVKRKPGSSCMICTHVNAKSTIQSKAKGLPVLTTMSKLYTDLSHLNLCGGNLSNPEAKAPCRYLRLFVGGGR